MQITENERNIINNKIKVHPCPLCGGEFTYYTQPFQLLSWKGDVVNEPNLNATEATAYNYLSAECKNCGYTILRRLDVLLRDSKNTNIQESSTQENMDQELGSSDNPINQDE